MQNINISYLLPANLLELFQIFINDGFSVLTAEQLSSFFVWCLIAIALLSVLFLIIKIYFIRKGIKGLSKQLKKYFKDNSISLYDITANAEKQSQKNPLIYWTNKPYHYWCEYNKTLLESSEGKPLATYDATILFNASSLGISISSIIPSILTGGGVLCTFIGLQLGLSELNISGDVDIIEMKEGVAGVINGAKIAFITSVWGVALSIAYTFVRKTADEIFVKKRIYELQNIINSGFKHFSSEEEFRNIAKHTGELPALAEQITTKMQESFKEMTNEISTPLKNALDIASGSNGEMIGNLINEFMEVFGKKAEELAGTMVNASEKLDNSLDELAVAIANFVPNLEQAKELYDTITTASQELTKSSEYMQNSSSNLSTVSTDMSGISNNFESASNNFSTNLVQAVESTDKLAEQNRIASNNFAEELKKFQDITDMLRNLINDTSTTFSTLKESQEEFLTSQQEHIDNSLSKLNEDGSNLLNKYAKQANTQTTEHLKAWADGTTEYTTAMTSAVKALSEVVDEIETKINQHKVNN